MYGKDLFQYIYIMSKLAKIVNFLPVFSPATAPQSML